MKKFLATYMGSKSPESFEKWNSLKEETRKEREASGMQAWMAWGQKYAHAIVDHGSPIGKTKQTGPKGVSDMKNLITGYVIIEAESHETAAKMFEEHPHFNIFPGDSVEIMECLPMPEMK
jgi:hypothetical protein